MEGTTSFPIVNTMKKTTKNTGGEVNEFVTLVTKNVVGSFETLTKAESFETTAKEQWTTATEAKDPAVIASLAKAIT